MMEFRLEDRVWYVWRQGYSEYQSPGTVTAVYPSHYRDRGGISGQLQDEIQVKMDDGNIIGGPVGHFRLQR